MYYFDDYENVIKLKKIVEEWIGTPWRHHCGVKGLGTDCIHFVLRVFQELGAVKQNVKVPDYPPDWHLHNTRELLCEEIERVANVERINDLSKVRDGDVVISFYGKASSHASIYLEGYIYHCPTNLRVIKSNFNDRYFRKHMKFIYRLKKES